MIWSFSFLSCYLNCPFDAYHRYVVKDIPYVETPQQKAGNEVHKALEHRLKGKPLPKELHRHEHWVKPLERYTIEPELRLGITTEGKPTDFFAKDVWGRGKIDVPIVEGDNAVILDWKNGKVWEDPFELRVQAVLLKAKYPNLKRIQGSYVWLNESRVGVIYDLSDVGATWSKICALMEEVAGSEWEKKPGKLCGFCPVKSCEHNRNKHG